MEKPFDLSTVPVSNFELPVPSANTRQNQPKTPLPLPPEEDDSDPPWLATPSPMYLPNKQPLRLTVSRKVLLEDLFGSPQQPFVCPRNGLESMFVLWLAAHPRSAWERPVKGEDGMMEPLCLRFHEMRSIVTQWTDEVFREPSGESMTAQSVMLMAVRLWTAAHATLVIPEESEGKVGPATTAGAMTTAQAGASSMSEFSPMETPQNGPKSSTNSPFETPSAELPPTCKKRASSPARQPRVKRLSAGSAP